MIDSSSCWMVLSMPYVEGTVMPLKQGKLRAALFVILFVVLATTWACEGFFVDPILVTLVVTPPTPTLVVGGESVQMTAFGTFDDGSKKNLNSSVIWTMNPPGYATIDKGGMLRGTSPSPS